MAEVGLNQRILSGFWAPLECLMWLCHCVHANAAALREKQTKEFG